MSFVFLYPTLSYTDINHTAKIPIDNKNGKYSVFVNLIYKESEPQLSHQHKFH